MVEQLAGEESPKSERAGDETPKLEDEEGIKVDDDPYMVGFGTAKKQKLEVRGESSGAGIARPVL